MTTNKLEERRQELKVSYKELSEKSKLSVATVRKILGEQYTSAVYGNVLKVAQLLGMTVTVTEEEPVCQETTQSMF